MLSYSHSDQFVHETKIPQNSMSDSVFLFALLSDGKSIESVSIENVNFQILRFS